MDAPEPPAEGAAVRLGRAAEARGLAASRWAGRGDEERGLSTLALGGAAAYFVVLFLPWLGSFGHTQSGWYVAHDPGVLALAVVLVEALRLSRTWASRGSGLLSFGLVAATGVLGLEVLATIRWGGLAVGGFSSFRYGAWLGVALAVLLIVVAALRLTALWRSAQ